MTDVIPTLQQWSTVPILVALWNHEKIKTLIESKLQAVFHENKKDWERIEAQIVENIRKLPLPTKLENQFADYLRPIGLELLAWVEFHFKHVNISPKIPNNLIWTSKGTIDLEKTAKILIHDENLDIYDCYKLACAYCQEDSICALWEKVKEIEIAENEYGLTTFWSQYKRGKISDLSKNGISPYEYAIKCSTESANIFGAKYFYQKLSTDEEKERVLHVFQKYLPFSRSDDVKWKKGDFLRKYCFGFFVFALNDLREYQKDDSGNQSFLNKKKNENRTFFPSSHRRNWYLSCFLDWPFQEILLEAAKRVWNLPPLKFNDYGNFLFEVVQKIIDGNDYDYISLFKRFWEYSPASSKRDTLYFYAPLTMPHHLYFFARSNNIPLVFKDASIVDKRAFEKYRQPFSLAGNDDNALLQWFLHGCNTYDNVMLKFKEDYKTKVANEWKFKIPKENWEVGLSNPIELGRRYDFIDCLDEFFEHEEKGKSLDKKYPNKPRKKYIRRNGWGSY